MRILFVSNFYPPARAWGYTQWCGEVCNGLRTRGHHVNVLTSNYDAPLADDAALVRRQLFLENDLNHYSIWRFFTRWIHEERADCQILTEVVEETRPDIIFVWGMYGLSRAVPATLEQLLADRVVYYVSDHWPADPTLNEAYWKLPTRTAYGRIIKPVLRALALFLLRLRKYPPSLEFRHAITVSAAVRRNLIAAGLPFEDSAVIHGGSDVTRFRTQRTWQNKSYPLRLLYAGFLGRHKGVHTIIEALSLLRQELFLGQLRLTIVGSGHPAYEHELQQLIQKYELSNWVNMHGRVSPQDMPSTLLEHDVLLFPSTYEEPFPRMVQEAMLSGLVVVGTVTGGTGELLIDGETGLVFKPGHARSLSVQIKRVLAEPQLVFQLAQRGRAKVLSEFTLDRMIDRIENYLTCVFRDSTAR